MDNDIMYMKGRNNLAVTLFVPWDCGRNCSFCTTKAEYQDMSGFSFNKQINTLTQIWYNPDIADVVITGGEPFADIPQLGELFSIISPLCALSHKNVFINTSKYDYPPEQFEELTRFIHTYSQCIQGVSVSNHIDNEWCPTDSPFIQLLRNHDIPVKMNCIVDHNSVTAMELIKFVLKWQYVVDTISFRRDYRTVLDDADLRDRDQVVKCLIDLFGRMTESGCEVCHDNVFKDGKVHYHRGYKTTSRPYPGNIIAVNDVIIKQDGKLYVDWEGSDSITPMELGQRWMATAKQPISGTRKHKAKEFKPVYSVATDVGYRTTCGGGGCGNRVSGGTCGSGGC